MDSHPQTGLSSQRCTICERACRLTPDKSGACGLYHLRQGQVVEISTDRYLAAAPISIETMPLLHFWPGHKFLQISTTGCNFDCPGCISTVIVREMPRDSRALLHLTPKQVVDKALSQGCMGIAFLMNDPLASLPSFLRVAALAKQEGLMVGCSTNAYFTEQSLDRLLPLLDFVNLGLKGFSDAAYRACGATAGMGPVMRNLESLLAARVHLELSVMYSQGNEKDLRALARHLACLSPATPLQLMRFIPFEGAEQSMEPSVRQAERFCQELRRILRHVYLFNTPGSPYLHTVCPACGQTALRREFYGPMGAKLLGQPPAKAQEVRCPSCGGGLDINGSRVTASHLEGAFQGGYPFTRALEMVEAMLIAMGVRRQSDIVGAWEHLLSQEDGLHELHHDVQHPRKYIAAVRRFGQVVNAQDQAEELARYLEEKLDALAQALEGVEHRPGVYYAMGKPLFYLGGGRLENQLSEFAGGVSLNKQLPPGGRPGRSLSVGQLNQLNPEYIFISAFLSNSPGDFLAECRELGVDVQAVRRKQVFAHPAPGWDFGSPRWILGLLYMAQVMHPGRCDYDVMEEAKAFYHRFYGMEFSAQEVNRSFAKPSDNWRWQGSGGQAALAPSAPEHH
ncbi:MAG: radical SAM protein [Deltaproteobacteria bacterium]|nr:radical SAM protein [Deltaproteobacteria bacterium]